MTVRVVPALVRTGTVPADPGERHGADPAVLHPWEVEQSLRLGDGETRSRYVHVHVEAHRWVAGVLGLDLDAFRIARRPCLRCAGEHGPPVVVSGPRHWYLSTTRTDRRFAFALSDEPVGVDLESVRRTLDLDAVGRVACSERERDVLRGLPADEARLTFFRWWTAKEAVTKATGHGLQADFRTVHERVGGAPGVWDFAGTAWAVEELDTGTPGVLGAVAFPHRP